MPRVDPVLAEFDIRTNPLCAAEGCKKRVAKPGIDTYCSPACYERVKKANQRAKKRLQAKLSAPDPGQSLADEIKKRLKETGPHRTATWLLVKFTAYRISRFRTAAGKAYSFPGFQRKWCWHIFYTYLTGGKLLILSPPRHGKTELLMHLDIFFIDQINPNIRILQIGGNQEIATNSVAAVRDELELNPRILGHDPIDMPSRFKPKGKAGGSASRTGMVWGNDKFVVDTRTETGIKSPTMVALGRGGKILSRDGDLLFIDDIEDDLSTFSESEREKTRRWWGITVMSRKEEHTAVVVIGSRQHPDDLYQYILEDPTWTTIVETMHDETCEGDPADPKTHFHCMLWPQVRTYRWYLEKRQDPLTAATFDMVYLNRPDEASSNAFSRSLVDSVCDPTRSTGHIPQGTRLIAGLDPAGTGYQAAFLYAFDPETNFRYAVDFDNRLGGGIAKAREIIRDWHAKYGCSVWVIEENLYHKAITKDELLRIYTQKEGITIYPHLTTKVNKWDPEIGVTSLVNWMRQLLFSIPWATPEDQARWREYRRQLIAFDGRRRAGSTNAIRTDLAMASWFPEERLRSWRKDFLAEQDDAPTGLSYPFGDLSTLASSGYGSLFG